MKPLRAALPLALPLLLAAAPAPVADGGSGAVQPAAGEAQAMPRLRKAGDKVVVSADGVERICRRLGELGSRLRSNRVCMTQAEWDEQRRDDRMLIDRSQMLGCVAGQTC